MGPQNIRRALALFLSHGHEKIRGALTLLSDLGMHSSYSAPLWSVVN